MSEQRDIRCGTCKYYFLGQRGNCEFPIPRDLGIKLPASLAKMSMWVDSGQDCKVWEASCGGMD